MNINRDNLVAREKELVDTREVLRTELTKTIDQYQKLNYVVEVKAEVFDYKDATKPHHPVIYTIEVYKPRKD